MLVSDFFVCVIFANEIFFFVTPMVFLVKSGLQKLFVNITKYWIQSFLSIYFLLISAGFVFLS